MKYSEELCGRGLNAAERLADWFCNIQTPMLEMLGDSGRVLYQVDYNDNSIPGSQWNSAFAIMGWLGSYKAFDDKRYLDCALGAGRYLKSLQVFNPFMKEHFGAIRELTPQTPWCYPRDSISVGWAFIELYRIIGDKEYLERAEILGQWFMREAFDQDGWPYWGVQMEDFFDPKKPPQICNDVQGGFHGGTLNFFYQLAQATGDEKWTGDFFVRMADYFVEKIQQPDGFFRSINRATRKPPENDPQSGLHCANDDLGTLGLLCAYKVTGDEKYLLSIEKFLNAVFAVQREDGSFEQSVASIPVVLNVLLEAANLINVPAATEDACSKALQALLDAQETRAQNHRSYGGILEDRNEKLSIVVARSGGYSLIYLLKEFAGIKELLTV